MGLFDEKFNGFDTMPETIHKWRDEGTLEKNLRNLERRIKAGEKYGEIPEAYNLRGKTNLKKYYTYMTDILETLKENEEREAEEDDRLIQAVDELLYDDNKTGSNRDDDDWMKEIDGIIKEEKKKKVKKDDDF
ncbi:MAG: hypothetical protein ILP07_07730, partial [Treponema sp.]|nr:hypothetical protein [Treponema sp.]